MFSSSITSYIVELILISWLLMQTFCSESIQAMPTTLLDTSNEKLLGQHERGMLHHANMLAKLNPLNANLLTTTNDNNNVENSDHITEEQDLLRQLLDIETAMPLEEIGIRNCNKWRSINNELQDLTGRRHSGPIEFRRKCRKLRREHQENMQKIKSTKEKLQQLNAAQLKEIYEIANDLEFLKKIQIQNDRKLNSTLKSLLQPTGQESLELKKKMDILEKIKNISRTNSSGSTDQRVRDRLDELDALIKSFIKQGMSLSMEQIDQLWNLYHEMNGLLSNEWHESKTTGLFTAYQGTLNGALGLLVKWTEEIELPTETNEKLDVKSRTSQSSGSNSSDSMQQSTIDLNSLKNPFKNLLVNKSQLPTSGDFDDVEVESDDIAKVATNNTKRMVPKKVKMIPIKVEWEQP